jgi:predicted nucleotidyltransferase
MLFGSAIKDYAHANDIDLMIVLDSKDVKEANEALKKKEEILPKKLHTIKLTRQDISDNLKKRDTAMVDIVKNAIILYGQDRYVEILKNAQKW